MKAGSTQAGHAHFGVSCLLFRYILFHLISLRSIDDNLHLDKFIPI